MKKLNLSVTDLIALRNHYENQIVFLNPSPEHFASGGVTKNKILIYRSKIENINNLIDIIYDTLFLIDNG
jgi:hypothetical protein